MKNHIVIKELIKREVAMELAEGLAKVEGFYKCGIIELSFSPESEEILICTQRYGEVDEVRNFDDLVLIHFNWWKKSKDRAEFWKDPESSWLEDYIRLDLIEEQIVKTYVPKS